MSDHTSEQKPFSKKFYIGVILIIASLIIGKVTQTTFIIYFNDMLIRKLSIIIYVISWIPFIWGIAWAGRDTMEKYNRFFTFKYYRDKFKTLKND